MHTRKNKTQGNHVVEYDAAEIVASDAHTRWANRNNQLKNWPDFSPWKIFFMLSPTCGTLKPYSRWEKKFVCTKPQHISSHKSSHLQEWGTSITWMSTETHRASERGARKGNRRRENPHTLEKGFKKWSKSILTTLRCFRAHRKAISTEILRDSKVSHISPEKWVLITTQTHTYTRERARTMPTRRRWNNLAARN